MNPGAGIGRHGALGDGNQKLPVATALRVESGKQESDTVEIHLTERLS